LEQLELVFKETMAQLARQDLAQQAQAESKVQLAFKGQQAQLDLGQLVQQVFLQ
jgi:hypothetical protein